MFKQGLRVKILKGEDAGKTGVIVAKAPDADSEPVWTVAVTGKGQTKANENDLEILGTG